MRNFFYKRQKGISMITLIITIVVMIVLSSVIFMSSNNSIKQTGIGIFVRELSLVRQAAHEKRMDNQVIGSSEENTYKGFYKTKIENPPLNFESFSEKELYGYVIDLEYVHAEDADRGHDYKKFATNTENNVAEFGVDDIFILDKAGNIFYVKGFSTDLGTYYSNSGIEIQGPEIVSVNKSIAGDRKSATLTIVVKKSSNGELRTKIEDIEGTRISTSEDGMTETFEAVVRENKTYVIMAEESGRGRTTKSITVTELDILTYVIRYIPNATDVMNMPNSQEKTEKVSAYLSTQIPERAGYTFLGWNEDGGSEIAIYRPGGEFIKDGSYQGEYLNLYAIWKVGKAQNYSVTYNANGGSNAPNTDENLSGDYIVTSSVPQRNGYNFIGWSTNPKATSAEYVGGDKITLTNNVTLYAVWSKDKYTLTITTMPEGAGTIVGAGEKNEGEEVFIIATAKQGYIFKNWSVKSGGINLANVTSPSTSFKMPKGNVEIVANYEVSECIVKYNANRGTGEPRNQEVAYGETITITSAKPTRDGYNFLGWSLRENATEATYKENDEYTVKQSVTFYAVWEVHLEKYTVKFNLNGGFGNINGEVGKFADITKTHGNPIEIPKGGENEPYKKDYAFKGWSLAADSDDVVLAPGDMYSRDANMELFAVWKDEIPPTIVFTPKQEVNSTEVKIIATVYDAGKIAEYAWTTSETYPTAWETNTPSEENLTLEKTINQRGTHYLWAKDMVGNYSFQSITAYEIKYDSLGGTNTPAIQYQLQDIDLILTSEIPEKEKYTFLGWSIAANPGNTMSDVNFEKGSKLNLNADTILRAVWGETFFDLSSKNVVTQIDGEKVEVTVTKHEYTGNISVESKNPEIASATITGNIITITPGTKIGDVEIVVTEDREGTTETIIVTVEKGIRQVTIDKTHQNFTYGDSSAQIQFSYRGKTTGTTVRISDNTVVTATISGQTITITPKNYGTSTITLVLAEDDQYVERTVDITVTVSKRQIVITPNSNQSKVYDGTTTTPTLTYTYTGNKGSETPKFSGALKKAVGSDVGNYEITLGNLTLENNGTFVASNYELVLSTTKVYFEITPKRIQFPTVNTPQQYDGNPKVCVPEGNDYVRGGDYQKTTPAVYTATITLKDTKNFIWDDTNTTTSRNVTWEIISTYYVKYNANNGSGTMSNSTHKYGVAQALTANTFIRSGYTFNGWNTKANGTGTSYADKASVNNLTMTNGGIVDLYAQWKSNEYIYNVVYESTSGKSLGTATVSKAFGTTNTISAPAKTGYNTPASQSIVWDSTTPKTITFIYTPTSYTITIDCNGGSGVSSTSYTIETVTFTLGIPTREGYIFDGWTGSNGTTPQTSVSIEKGTTGNKNYKANWTSNSYTYDIVYKSESGVDLGSSTVTKVFGTTNTISAPAKTGYNTPASQSITWDTTTKTITFIYTPTEYTIEFDLNGGIFDSILTQVKIGDYVNYSANGVTSWRVFDIVDRTVLITPANGPVGGVTLGNADGYANAITRIEAACDNYTNSSLGITADDIRSMTTEDINKVAGYTLTKTITRYAYYLNGDSSYSSGTLTYNGNRYTKTKHGHQLQQGWTTPRFYEWDYAANVATDENGNRYAYPSSGKPVYVTDSYYDTYSISSYNHKSNSSIKVGSLLGSTDGWLASISSIAKAEYVNYYIYTANSDSITRRYTIDSGADYGSRTYGVRPLVALGPNISATRTSSSNPWELSLTGRTQMKYTVETATFSLETPTREEYIFKGWTGSNGTTPQTSVSIEKGTTGNKNYKANWEGKDCTYNVVYKSTSGVDLGSATVTKKLGTTNTISAPAKTGYNTPASQVIEWDTETKTITFTYNPTSYSITIDCAGGTGVSSTSYTIETATFTLGTPTRTGYTFAGWTGSNGATAQTTVTITKGSTGAKSYTANWTASNYTYNVVYRSVSGVDLDRTRVTKQFGTTNVIDPIEITGYETPQSKTVTWDIESKTIIFIYDLTSYSITINCNGGSGVSSTSYNIETTTFTLGTPTRTNYTFLGWTGSNGSTPQKTVTITKGSTGARNYTANWEAPVMVHAIYSATDQSLTFVNDSLQSAGGTYNGKAVTAVYTGIETNIYNYSTYAPWNSYASVIKTVTFKDKITPVGTSCWFFNFSNLTTINNITNLDTSNTTRMDFMFYGCSKMTSINLNHFNTEKVTNMGGMFAGCSLVTSIGVDNFNTKNVTDMSGMFNMCPQLTTLNISSFDTSKVTTMYAMFSGNKKLSSIDVSSFDTSNVTDMYSMFGECESLTTLDLSTFNTSKVTTIGRMFNYCRNLKTIYVSKNWVSPSTSSNDADSVFEACTNLVGGAGTAFATARVINITYAHIDGGTSNPGYFTLKGAGGLYDANDKLLASWDDLVNKYGFVVTASCSVGSGATTPTSMYYVLNKNSELATGVKLIIPDDAGVTTIGPGAFYDCNQLTSVVLPAGLVTIRTRAFGSCDNLATINIPETVMDIQDYAFYFCGLETMYFEHPEGWYTIFEINQLPVTADFSDPEEAAYYMTKSAYAQWISRNFY